MAQPEHTISIHPLAPTKVPVGAACNGCGVCCLFTPCPLGMLLSRRRSGACDALHWDAVLMQYRCGAIVAPREVLVLSLPRALHWLTPVLAPTLRRLGRRWIAAGVGCDSTLEVDEYGPSQHSAAAAGTASPTMPAKDLLNDTVGRTAVRHPQP